MQKAWNGKTYGNGWMHKWLVRILRVVDVRIIYSFVALFVIPPCLVLNASRGVAYRYFRKRHGYGRLRAAWKTYVNHCLFGTVVVDRFAAYAGRRFKIEIEGFAHFQHLVEREEGFLQLSAHFGNYEMAGYSLKTEKKPFNALVFAGEKESVMESRRQMFAETGISMIAVRPDMGHLFEINEALARGSVVSMPADRHLGSGKSVRRTFLGADADFPAGPFSVATMRGLDVIAVNVAKTKWDTYHIYVTPLPYDKDATRREQVDSLVQAYVAELERVVRRHPEQWYNYFEFWTDEHK